MSAFRNIAAMPLQRGDEVVRGLHRALAGVVAPDETRQLPTEIGMHAEIVELAEIALLDGLAFLGQQFVTIEHEGLVGLEFLAKLDIPLQVLDQVVGGEVWIEFFPSHGVSSLLCFEIPDDAADAAAKARPAGISETAPGSLADRGHHRKP